LRYSPKTNMLSTLLRFHYRNFITTTAKSAHCILTTSMLSVSSHDFTERYSVHLFLNSAYIQVQPT
jgi:hypothetical protein